ncbi:N-acetylglucosamine kinase [Polaribacter reichenbachii]|uniref:N-acetylglucosamine kinase n=1 Tax=Polaribacter reichenbachii TaxID=996801 RepID=A0A1B8U3D5_9FLAO|nr:N-acetylglucosamine kinase [Polaribacter reichenbachii]APZ46559.1 N-acetylglucosamine kinase [Polaribacter reichenbachii]AUC17205.1 N-acetylglucosamine kinase [Polaribacter reichenbachii]OBY66383.1 N-acetylglucosamine kinase [Polaribacter reichenbachii]
MILIADGGSTKADWIAINLDKTEAFRVRTLGLNPAVVAAEELNNRIINMFQLIKVKAEVTEIYFYGAGCGTPKPAKILEDVLQSIFVNAKVYVAEDMLAAVYAATGTDPALVCILGTGSNSCFFDGKNVQMNTPSLGYILMDEASGNYFGKVLLRAYYYNRMPAKLAEKFEAEFNLDADFIKKNLYREANPNMYLASFAKFMFDFKDDPYIHKIIRNGFKEFFEYRVLPFNKTAETPLYFIGSIAFYFRDILEEVAIRYDLKVTDVIQRPIDNLLAHHRNLML